MLRDFVYKVLTIRPTISETGFVCMYSCICDTYVSTIPKKPRDITQWARISWTAEQIFSKLVVKLDICILLGKNHNKILRMHYVVCALS